MNRIGRVGREQMRWNASIMKRWRSVLKDRLACCVSGIPAVVVGHIEDICLAPHRRHDPLNVAPISRRVNGRMKYDLRYREHARRVMEAWVLAFWKDHPEA